MRFGKTTFFLFLNGLIAFSLLCYFAIWMLLGHKAIGHVTRPYQAGKITVTYNAEGKDFVGEYMRNDIPYSQTQVHLRYLQYRPSASRVNSFMGLFAEPLAWWLVFLIASSMLFLMDNTVFSRGTTFLLQKKFPWISMDEYFPFYQNRYREDNKTKGPDHLSLPE